MSDKDRSTSLIVQGGVADSAALDRSLPLMLLRAREAVMDRFRPLLMRTGVTEQQWRVMRVLAEGGAMEAGAVARAACLLPPSLSRIIRTLEGSELISTERSAEDGRRVVLSLTRRGRKLVRDTMQEGAKIYAAIEAEYGTEELETLFAMLHRVQTVLAGRDGGNGGGDDG
jgi:homoprotocatechuate degradation regulator HpaR